MYTEPKNWRFFGVSTHKVSIFYYIGKSAFFLTIYGFFHIQQEKLPMKRLM